MSLGIFFNFMYFYVPRLLLENKTQPLRLRTNVLLIFLLVHIILVRIYLKYTEKGLRGI